MSSDDGSPGFSEAPGIDEDGGIDSEKIKAPEEEIEGHKIDLELERIRDRRINPDNSFMVNTIIPQTFDDYTLVFGLIAGALFFGSVFLTSSGLLFEDSITLDDKVSGTFLDPSDCIDKTAVIWFETWVDQDQDLRVLSQNAPTSTSSKEEPSEDVTIPVI